MFYLVGEVKLDGYETWLERKWKCQLWRRIVLLFYFTLTEKITDKSVDVPGDFVGVTIRTENN